MNNPARRRILIRRAALAGTVLLAVIVLVLALGGGGGPKRLVPGGGNAGGTFDPLAFSPARTGLLEQAASDGLAHVLYAKSPGGILAAARRTAAFRPLIDAAAKAGPIDADTLEAIVLLESSGRPDIVAGADPSAAAGLTQIVAQTGTGLLGMHIDLAASRRLLARIARASGPRAAALRRQLGRVDGRFNPATALAATEHYLTIARRTFGRDDLAVESYHMGIGNLQTALRSFGGGAGVSYAELYVDSTPLVHTAAYRFLAGLGDDSETYLWRVYAARNVMALYRADPAGLARATALQTAAPSAELALRPPAATPVLADPAAVARARAQGALVGLPVDAAARGLRADGPFHLRPDALAVALYIAAAVRAIGQTAVPLELTAATTDAADLAAAARAAHGLADSDRLHATGYAFDVARSYASPAQAVALQFILDRLTALDVIAWQRHARIIHIVAGPRASLVRGVLTAGAG